MFVTVIEIDAKQYAKMEIGGLFVILEMAAGGPAELCRVGDFARKGSLEDGDDRPLYLGISIL